MQSTSTTTQLNINNHLYTVNKLSTRAKWKWRWGEGSGAVHPLLPNSHFRDSPDESVEVEEVINQFWDPLLAEQFIRGEGQVDDGELVFKSTEVFVVGDVVKAFPVLIGDEGTLHALLQDFVELFPLSVELANQPVPLGGGSLADEFFHHSEHVAIQFDGLWGSFGVHLGVGFGVSAVLSR